MRSTLLAATLLVLAIAYAQETQTPQPRGRVLGIGGVFFKSPNQQELYAWYEKHLGFKREPKVGVRFHWRLPGHPDRHDSTTWGIFKSTSKYFDPSPSPFMINYVVDDLDAILKRLEAEGVKIDPRRESDAAGKFAWIYDSDGNKIELWEPGKEVLAGK